MDYRIVVDAGHGGTDSGAVSGNLQEKDFNLAAANYMYNRFKELGIPVTITRNTDKTLTRAERLNTMRSLGTDPKVIILSNHINAGGGEGAEVVYPLRSNSTLPSMILDEIGKEGQITRKIYQRRLDENPSKDYYYIMRETPNTTSLLIEYGFIDNKNDQVKLKNNILNYAEAVVRAVANYIGVPYNKGETSEDTYTVKAGDTLYGIARRFNTTVDELIRLNNLNSTILSIGQVILIKGKSDDNSNSNNTYTVNKGDTLYSIAKRFGVTVQDLVKTNNLTSTTLSIGQVLIIPSISDNTPSTQTYTVQKGDSLWSIARKLNTTVDDLKSINNLVTNILQIGQILLIP